MQLQVQPLLMPDEADDSTPVEWWKGFGAVISKYLNLIGN
jgi:hypothetical protein